jgi:predicted RecB family endonuclease
MSGPTSAALAPFVLTIGRRNVELILGVSWATARRLARELGVAELRLTERLVLLDGQALITALRARAERARAELEPVTDEQEREQIRAALGLERRCA